MDHQHGVRFVRGKADEDDDDDARRARKKEQALREQAREEIEYKARKRERERKKQALLRELAEQELAAKTADSQAYRADVDAGVGKDDAARGEGRELKRDSKSKKSKKSERSKKHKKHKKHKSRKRDGSDDEKAGGSSRRHKHEGHKKKSSKHKSKKSKSRKRGRDSSSESESESSDASSSSETGTRSASRPGADATLANKRRAAGLDWFAPAPATTQASDPALAPAASDDAQQANVPTPEPATAGLTASVQDVNKLAAKAMRAKLKGDMALHDSLQSEVEALRRASAPAPRGRAPATNEEAVLAPLGADGRYLGSLARAPADDDDRYITSADTRKRKRGLYREKELAAQEQNMSVEEMLHREKEEVGMDRAYAENIIKRNRHDKLKYLEGAGPADEVLESAGEAKQIAMYQSRKSRMTETRAAEVDRQSAINAHRHAERAERACPFSFQSPQFKRHLVVAVGEFAYLMMPVHPIAPGHVRIIPLEAVPAMTAASEGLRAEVSKFQAALERMYGASSEPQSLVYMETVPRPDRIGWHTCLECVPVDESEAEMVPIFFKKALIEAGDEWSAATHKAIATGPNRPLEHAIPPDFAYFHVAWGGGGYPRGGYAHRIEDPQLYKPEFGADVLRGLRGDSGLRFGRRREPEAVERRRVAEFQAQWRAVDFTTTASS